MNKPVYLILSALDLIRTVMYHYVKPNYGENANFCCMDTDSFIAHVKTEDIYKDIVGVKDLKLQFLTETDHCLKKKIKTNWINER